MSQKLPRLSAAIATAIVLGCSVISHEARAQNLFEFLFGGERAQPAYQPPQAQGQSAAPLQMRVRPRRAAVEDREGGHIERRTVRLRPGEAPTRVARAAKPARLASPIDPKANPNWHLIDPTLKRGDVVVLKGQVLVYEGGGTPTTRDSFTALGLSKHLSKTERQEVEKIAALPDASRSAAMKQTEAVLASAATE